MAHQVESYAGRVKPLIVVLAGVGQDAGSWDEQVQSLAAYPFLVVTAGELANGDFSFEVAVETLHTRIVEVGAESVVLVGLSLGGMIATRYAALYQETLHGLLLSGSQVKPNPVVMGLQRGIMRLLPARKLPLPEGITKPQFLAMLDAAAKADFRQDLPKISAKTLVLCGSKDPFNIPAAKRIATAVPHAELRIVEGGGHELNTEKPEEFTQAIQKLL